MVERRDLLADVAAVLDGNTEPVPASEVAAKLRADFPHHREYRKFTKVTLAAALGDRGVPVPSTSNRYPVDPVEVRKALAAEAAVEDVDSSGDV